MVSRFGTVIMRDDITSRSGLLGVSAFPTATIRGQVGVMQDDVALRVKPLAGSHNESVALQYRALG